MESAVVARERECWKADELLPWQPTPAFTRIFHEQKGGRKPAKKREAKGE